MKRNRSTLRNYFRSGRMPTEDHFHDLIDSSLNCVDEGFDRDAENGVKISTLGDEDALMSWYRWNNTQAPKWHMRFDGSTEHPALAFQQFGSPVPALRLDGAFVETTGRAGVPFQPVAADGAWHAITPPLVGCAGFEVFAQVKGQRGSGEYALIHAIALKSHHKKIRRFSVFRRRQKRAGITETSGAYRNHYRLRLKWDNAVLKPGESLDAVAGEPYQLFLGARCDYQGEVSISGSLIRLFDDDGTVARTGTSRLAHAR